MGSWPNRASQDTKASINNKLGVGSGPLIKEGLVWLGLLLPIAFYGGAVAMRSPRTPISEQPLFQGITYQRIVETSPRPQVIHLLAVDLTEPGIQPFVTPDLYTTQVARALASGEADAESAEDAVEEIAAALTDKDGQPLYTEAFKTSSFLTQHGLQLAVNANFFYPFREVSPWNYEPHEAAYSGLVGLSISDGELISMPHPEYSALCFTDRQAVIVWQTDCPVGTQQAVSGQPLWMGADEPPAEMLFAADKLKSTRAYPLTIAALNKEGTKLWLLLSDGKQPLYSEGTTIKEALTRLNQLGAVSALQLDGGGSTTLVTEQDGAASILNAVIHTKIPGRERPVANHLGFYALPIETNQRKE